MKVESPDGKTGIEVHRTLKVFRLQNLSFLFAKMLLALSKDLISTQRGSTIRLISQLLRLASFSIGRGSNHCFGSISFRRS